MALKDEGSSITMSGTTIVIGPTETDNTIFFLSICLRFIEADQHPFGIEKIIGLIAWQSKVGAGRAG